ncbi:unnamed protein product [Spirodela intermedia]|uniref:Uncharacterized protein n=1 Tax=Spirodela intermedia TaxID=51605 RepID=A0A7I8L832_SPIIN|nr:unnamed protein product [Spirodela intermedia]
MKWVVESSPMVVTWWIEKRRLCGSPATVTRQRGAGWRWDMCQGALSSYFTSSINIFITSSPIDIFTRCFNYE